MQEETPETKLAVALNSLTLNMGFMAETLKRIEKTMETFALKSEIEEMKRDWTATIKRIDENFDQHNKDDKASFSTLNRNFWLAVGGGAVLIWIVNNLLAPALIQHFFTK